MYIFFVDDVLRMETGSVAVLLNIKIIRCLPQSYIKYTKAKILLRKNIFFCMKKVLFCIAADTIFLYLVFILLSLFHRQDWSPSTGVPAPEADRVLARTSVW